MSLLQTTPVLPGSPARAARRQGVRHDVLGARLAELARIGDVVEEARRVVEQGWVQHGWFAYVDEVGRSRVATVHDLHLVAGRPVVGACLVGAVLMGGGGMQAAGTQLVDRTLDLTWHTLRLGDGQPVRWCPSPADRAANVRDLTGWNDSRCRTSDDVVGLLAGVGAAAAREGDRTRREHSAG